jgi:hypothetical protein
VYRVYVDESGGRNISPRSDKHFVLSAVIVHDSHNETVRHELVALKGALGRLPHHVLHFSTLKKHRRPVAAAGIAGFSIARIVSVIICKDVLGEESAAGAVPFIAQPSPMYLWGLRLLLERVSWYCRNMQRQPIIVTFGRVTRFTPAELHAYREALEQAPPEKDVRIDWAMFAGHPFRIANPAEVDLLQVADVAASSTFHAVELEKDGATYLERLKPVLYRHNGICAPTYGLAVYPKSAGEAGGELHWLCSL